MPHAYAVYTRKHRWRGSWHLYAKREHAREIVAMELPLAEAMPHGELSVYLVRDDQPLPAKFTDNDVAPGELRHQTTSTWTRHAAYMRQQITQTPPDDPGFLGPNHHADD
jgi:hypothetical protein